MNIYIDIQNKNRKWAWIGQTLLKPTSNFSPGTLEKLAFNRGTV